MLIRNIALVAVTIFLVTSCGGGPSRSISQETTVFPKCDVAKETVVIDRIVCSKGLLCARDDKASEQVRNRLKESASRPISPFAAGLLRGYAPELIVPTKLINANEQLARMLANALSQTGCFSRVDIAQDSGVQPEWRVMGNLESIKINISNASKGFVSQFTRTTQPQHKVNIALSVAVQDGDHREVASKKLKVTAERTTERHHLAENFRYIDWSGKKTVSDVDSFGDNALQDAANELILEAAILITERAAGSRIARHVAPPMLNSDTPAAKGPAEAVSSGPEGVTNDAQSPFGPDPEVPDAMVSVTRQKKIIKLEGAEATFESRGLGTAYNPTQVFAVIRGAKSAVQLHNEDIFHFSIKRNSPSARSGYLLYPCKVDGDTRKCRMMAMPHFGQDDIALKSLSAGPISRFLPAKPFDPGEYCFGRRSDLRLGNDLLRGDVVVGRGQVFCFSVT
jgi:hypothetical protein